MIWDSVIELHPPSFAVRKLLQLKVALLHRAFSYSCQWLARNPSTGQKQKQKRIHVTKARCKADQAAACDEPLRYHSDKYKYSDGSPMMLKSATPPNRVAQFGPMLTKQSFPRREELEKASMAATEEMAMKPPVKNMRKPVGGPSASEEVHISPARRPKTEPRRKRSSAATG